VPSSGYRYFFQAKLLKAANYASCIDCRAFVPDASLNHELSRPPLHGYGAADGDGLNSSRHEGQPVSNQ